MTTPIKVIKSITVTDTILASSNVPESDVAAWSASTTYAALDRCFVGHTVYQSIAAGNINKPPASSTTEWVEVGPTNRWRMFDLSSTTQTTIGASCYYEFAPGQAVNAMSLINMSGITSIRLRLTDPAFGVVYDRSLDITPVPSESGWYAWFFEMRVEQTMAIIDDMPSYPNATLRVDITSSGTGYVGGLAFGSMRDIGMGVLQGAKVAIQDYSRKERNDFGDTVLVKRAFSKRSTVSTIIDNDDLDNVYDLLADLRSTPCLWLLSDKFRALAIFGYYSSFDINIAYASHSDCTLEIEGLT